MSEKRSSYLAWFESKSRSRKPASPDVDWVTSGLARTFDRRLRKEFGRKNYDSDDIILFAMQCSHLPIYRIFGASWITRTSNADSWKSTSVKILNSSLKISSQLGLSPRGVSEFSDALGSFRHVPCLTGYQANCQTENRGKPFGSPVLKFECVTSNASKQESSL